MSRSADKAYQIIHDAIVNAHYAPGAHLKEEELSTTVGVSRTPIREALRRLANEGLVAFSKNQGTFVEKFTDEDVEEIFQLRAMLEAYGARRAATRIDHEALEKLEALTADLEALHHARQDADYVPRFNQLNADFHRIILDAAQSGRLEAMLETIIDIPLILMKHYSWDGLVDLGRSCQQHRELIAAFRARDAEWAGSLMHAHVLGARGNAPFNGSG
jgi:DNA-binding GntR family transcriptional regulator